jgi:outer membrane protein TolC
MVVVRLNWDIFDGFTRQGVLLFRSANRSRALMENATLKLDIEQNLRTAYATMTSSLASIEAEKEATSLSRTSSAQAQTRYETGLATLQEVLDTQVTWQNAQFQELTSILQYNAAVYRIRYLAAMPEGMDDDAPTAGEIVDESGIWIRPSNALLPIRED